MLSAPPPTVSVVTIFWNQERWVDACAESVLRQVGPALEWVAIENGSTDETAARLRSWATRDVRLRVDCVGENLRQIGGLGRALAQVRGTFVALLDGDDMMLPERLARSVAWLSASSRHVAVYGEAQFIDDAGVTLPPWFIARNAHALRRLAEFTMPAIHSTGTWRADTLQRCFIPLSRGTIAYDYFLLTRALEEGEVGWLSDALAAYRVHAANESHQHPARQLGYGMAFSMLAARRRAGLSPNPEQALDWAQALDESGVDEANAYRAAAWYAWREHLPRHAIYYARRAIRRGAWTMLPLLVRVLWSERRRLRPLWPILRGGLLAVAGVDGRGRSLPNRYP